MIFHGILLSIKRFLSNADIPTQVITAIYMYILILGLYLKIIINVECERWFNASFPISKIGVKLGYPVSMCMGSVNIYDTEKNILFFILTSGCVALLAANVTFTLCG